MVLIFGLRLVLLIAVLLEAACKFDCHRDILVLRALVSTREQDDKRFASADEIHAIAGAVVDSHFGHTATERFRVAGIADRKSTNSGIDTGSRPTVAQVRQPTCEDLGL